MLKQLYNRTKNTLVIFLVFFVIISMTASAVSAQSSVLNVNHHHTAIAPPPGKIFHIVSHQEAVQNFQNQASSNIAPPGSNNFDAETPGSIACVYKLVNQSANEPGVCEPSNTPNNPVGGNGSIAIISHGDYPTARSDLSAFSEVYGLPLPDASNSDPSNFQVKYVGGPSPYITGLTPPPLNPPGTLNPEIEPALDVQWAHAMAPNAKIFLVEAQSLNIADIEQAFQAAQYLVSTHGGGEVSFSWILGNFSNPNSDTGKYTPPTQEQINSLDQIIQNPSYTNVTYLAASGDIGAPMYPAGSPYVIAVGGTLVNRNANMDFVSETPWNYPSKSPTHSSGSGPFFFANSNELRPPYQDSVKSIVGAYRGVPDITMLAHSLTPLGESGVPIVFEGSWTTDPNGIWATNPNMYGVWGGTSLSAPLAAGILNTMNITNSNSEQTIFNTLYNWGPDPKHFRDITSGTVEDLSTGDPNSGNIYTATPGFDQCTGWGSLVGNATGSVTPKATPNITWSNPADICQGKPLSYDQLDASATNLTSGAVLPGTFNYNPGVGTVLRGGQNQSLNVTFVPGDSTYNTASKNVYINVNECPEKHGFFHQTEYSTFLPFQWG